MKRYLALFMTLVLIFLVGCSESAKEKETLADYNLEEFTEAYNVYMGGFEDRKLNNENWVE